MAKINIEGLGIIEIEGDNPSSQEINAIQQLLKKKTVDSIVDVRKYKEQNPENKNVPSVELAEKVYNENYKNKDIDETTFYQKFFPNIAKEKFEEAEGIIVSPDDMMLGKTELDYV